MLTGVEIIGLILGVLPLFIAAAKPYREGLDTMKTALRSKFMDEKLEDFYRELEYEVTLLKYTLENLVESLPIVTEEEKDCFIERFEASLLNNEALTRAFNERLGRASDTFESYLRQILRLLEKVVDDDTLPSLDNNMVSPSKSHGGVSSSDHRKLKARVQSQQQEIYPKLLILRDGVVKGRSLAALRRRIRFSAREDKRARLLRSISKCNERLERLLSLSSPAGPVIAQKQPSRNGPPVSLRKVAHTLYDVVSCCWVCDCPIRHQAKLCLKCRHSDPSEIDFDMLFSTKDRWQEGRINIAPEA